MHLPFIACMDYTHKIKAQGLIERGITLAPLYFWHNLLFNHYSLLPVRVLEFDLQYYSKNYPEFALDFTEAHKAGQAL